MKRIYINRLIAGVFSLAVLFSCAEDTMRGPLVKEDSTAPAQLSEIKVENVSGGSIITYKLPSDEDLLYVEATYKRNDKTIITKSSTFENTIKVEGIRGEPDMKVSLVTVDRSENRSQPVSVDIKPLKAPIDNLFENITLQSTFGGVRVGYDNVENIRFELLMHTKQEDGTYSYDASAFIENNKRNGYSFRGYDPEPRTFALVAVDRWDNSTDTLEVELIPEEENMLDLQKFSEIRPRLATDQEAAWGWVVPRLWDDNKGSGFHTSQSEPGHIVPPYDEPYHIVSLDLGVKVNLSRLKLWLRTDCCGAPYGHGDPRYFEVWGIDELPDHKGETLEGWTKLVEDGQVIKPSGSPIGQHSAADRAANTEGHEFEVLDPAAEIRYIRFVNFQSWSGGKFMHFMELHFWGKEVQ